jgi:hypothetical protein
VYSSSSSFISKSESDSGGANVGAGTITEGLGVSDLALLAVDWRLFGFGADSAAFSTTGDWCSCSGGPEVAKVSSSSVTSHESVGNKQLMSVICVSRHLQTAQVSLVQALRRRSMPPICRCGVPLQALLGSLRRAKGNGKSLEDFVDLLGFYEPNLFCITLRYSRRPPESTI